MRAEAGKLVGRLCQEAGCGMMVAWTKAERGCGEKQSIWAYTFRIELTRIADGWVRASVPVCTATVMKCVVAKGVNVSSYSSGQKCMVGPTALKSRYDQAVMLLKVLGEDCFP